MNFFSMRDVKIDRIDHRLAWQIRHEVMYPNQPFEIIKLANEEEGIHFGLYVDEELTSVVSLFWDKGIYQFRKFATKTAAQGCGYGSDLLKYLISYSKEAGGKQLWCSARVSATGFYAKFGFKRSGQIFTKNNLDFVIMELLL